MTKYLIELMNILCMLNLNPLSFKPPVQNIEQEGTLTKLFMGRNPSLLCIAKACVLGSLPASKQSDRNTDKIRPMLPDVGMARIYKPNMCTCGHVHPSNYRSQICPHFNAGGAPQRGSQ